jgi:hypothetical protein
VFRGKFLALLRQASVAGELSLLGRLSSLSAADAFASWLDGLYRKEWVVYAKPPFGGPAVVLKYLAQYTHRVAISNHRLLSLEDGQVSLTYKDYAHGSKRRVLTLSAEEFLRRFVQHVLPKGFVKVRHYGLLSNRSREAKLSRCRWLLVLAGLQTAVSGVQAAGGVKTESCCPVCGGQSWVVVEVRPRPQAAGEQREGVVMDTS